MSVARSAVRRMATVNGPLAATSPVLRHGEPSPGMLTKFWKNHGTKVQGTVTYTAAVTSLLLGYREIAISTVDKLEESTKARYEKQLAAERQEREKFQTNATADHQEYVRRDNQFQADMQAQLHALSVKMHELKELEFRFRKTMAMIEDAVGK